jgi:predicted dehydrogenase
MTAPSRREFLTTTSALAGAAAVAGPLIVPHVHAIGSEETIRVGLIGCGGRGTGAAAQALKADKRVKLTAMGDAFEDRLLSSLKILGNDEEIAQKLDVKNENRFVGFDAYKKVIDSDVHVVLMCEPPHFRPMHLKYAIEKGKHVFAEKPVAVDAPGVRSVLATCEEARKKSLSVVSGLCIRYDQGFRETIKRIHDGAIGDVFTLQANDFRGPIWVKPRQPGWSDMTYHMKNWYYFTWLSGDFNVEQHVHMLDVCAWVMNGKYPVSAVGTGGRAVRTGPEYGNIFDHHAVIYEYENGARLFATCRQQRGCKNNIGVTVFGTKGMGTVNEGRLALTGGTGWKYAGKHENMYQQEHNELFASIRAGKPINNGEYMAKSSMLAILGRMATYTGQQITWDQAMNSKEHLVPDKYDWDGTPPASPIAIPGQTKLV